jgi:hypothetical protein
MADHVTFEKGVLVIKRKRGRRPHDPDKMTRAAERYIALYKRGLRDPKPGHRFRRTYLSEKEAAKKVAAEYRIGMSTLRRFVSENFENFENSENFEKKKK